ncbi:MAG: hypothetical protein HY561_07185 [Gemmatimonadetes bacterium]|nr:hypothetical protein [Gemmatimonadota bacterium]
MKNRRILRAVGITLVTAGVVAGLGYLLVRDQIARHRRDLFSPQPLRRLAALGYLSGREASVDAVRLLRDFIAWEQRPLLRGRAIQILERMEDALEQAARGSGEAAG